MAGGLALDAVLGFESGDVTRPVNFNDPTQPVEPADSSGRLVVITAAFFREPFE